MRAGSAVPHWVHQAVRFATTGGVGLVANLSLLALLVEVGGIPRLPAAAASQLTVLAAGFLLTDRWVFAGRTNASGWGGYLSRGGSYYAVMLTGKLVNFGIYAALLDVGVWYPVAWTVGSVLVFVGTFSANKVLWERVFD